MNSSNPFSLILNCGGFKYNDVILCAGTTNILINFDKHVDAQQIEKIIDFLDYSCLLFDKPIIDWNKIVNTLKMFKEQYHLIDDQMWLGLTAWLPQHKKCGASLSLCLNSELNLLELQEHFITPKFLKK